jgi:phosphoserine phosphatase
LLVKTIERVITGIPVKAFRAAADGVMAEYKDQVYRYTRELITHMRAKGYVLLSISGSPQEVVGPLGEYYGFDHSVGSEYIRRGNRFTGEVSVSAANKPELLQQLVKQHHLTYKGSVGIGDGEGDISMLELVEQPIAFNPSKKLFRHARTKGWKVVLERKNMIYELEARDGEYRLSSTNAN